MPFTTLVGSTDPPAFRLTRGATHFILRHRASGAGGAMRSAYAHRVRALYVDRRPMMDAHKHRPGRPWQYYAQQTKGRGHFSCHRPTTQWRASVPIYLPLLEGLLGRFFVGVGSQKPRMAVDERPVLAYENQWPGSVGKSKKRISLRWRSSLQRQTRRMMPG